MSQPTDLELARFQAITFNLSEDLQERGHHVGEAMDVDGDFRTGTARSALLQGLVCGSARRSASQLGFDHRSVGTGFEFIHDAGGLERRYRLRRCRRRPDGSLHIPSRSDAGIVPLEGWSNWSMWEPEYWVYTYIVADDCQLEDAWIARVAGVTVGNPGSLKLADERRITPTAPRALTFEQDPSELPGFEPEEEDLEGLFDDDIETDEGSSGQGS